MPDTNYPPFESGALAIPRQLNRWLDKNPQGGPLRRVDTYITLPAFSVANTWIGVSDIVTSFNFQASNNFSLTSNYIVPANPNYVLCVSYRTGGNLIRYMLWNATGSNMNQDIPLYAGQPIKKNFRFEVWNTSQGAVSQATEFKFYTSKLGSIDYRFGADYALATDGGQITAFSTSAPPQILTVTYTYSGGITPGVIAKTIYNFIVGKSYTLLSTSPSYVQLTEDTLGHNPKTGTFVATQTTYVLYSSTFASPASVTISLPYTQSAYSYLNFIQYSLPLTFPSNSVSTTN